LPSEGRSSRLNTPPVTIAEDFFDLTASTSKGDHMLTIDIEQNGHNLTSIVMSEMGTLGNS